MPRASRSVLALVLVTATLLVAVPTQAAVALPQSVESVWNWLLDGWASWTPALAGPSESQESHLSVAVGKEGPSISIDGFAPEGQPPDASTQSTQPNTLDPDELPTEEGPSISIDG